MRRTTVVCTSFMVLILSSCTTRTVTMVPVEGPLSNMTPIPVIRPHVDGKSGNTGNISLTMPDGEKCRGRWSSAVGAGVSFATGSLISTYGNIYGTGISTGHGQNLGQAIVTCERDTIIQVEFVTDEGTANGFGNEFVTGEETAKGFGFAKDNKGNVYRLIH